MKTSLNTARLGAGDLDLFGLIELAARHHFDGLDFGVGSAMKAAETLGGPDLLKNHFAARNVAPAVFGLDVEWRKDQDTFEQGMATLHEKARFAQLLGAKRCTTWMPPSVNMDYADWERMVVRRFGEIARVLEEHDIRFGLEWVGPHHLRAGQPNAMGANAGIYTMQDTLALIEKIGVPTVGLLVDAYHCYTTGVTPADLAALSDADIVHVHINDTSATPEEARDGERILPGTGRIDLPGFFEGLRGAGYLGYVATEVLAPKNLADDPDTAAVAVRTAMKSVGV